MNEVKQKNPKALATMNVNLQTLDKLETKVGFFESARYEGGRPVAAVAAGNELGIPSRSIPPRPFMRPAANEKGGPGGEWAQITARLAKKMLTGEVTAEDVMELLGLTVQGDIRKSIEAVTQPPLSKITLGARKYRREGKEVTGRTIGEIARLLDEGKLDISGVPDKPLDDTGHMIDSVDYKVSAQ